MEACARAHKHARACKCVYHMEWSFCSRGEGGRRGGREEGGGGSYTKLVIARVGGGLRAAGCGGVDACCGCNASCACVDAGRAQRSVMLA
jgi:hypothetical protein